MIFPSPALILPPERPALVRAADLKGVPSVEQMKQRINEKKAIFPFTFVGFGDSIAYTYNGTANDVSNLSSYSFASFSLGSATSDRFCVIGCLGTQGSTKILTSATIGGQTASITQSAGAANWAGFAYCGVSSGATGTVALTFGGAFNQMTIYGWSIYGIASPTVTASDFSQTASQYSATITNNRFMFMIGLETNNTTTFTLTGVTMESGADQAVESHLNTAGSTATTGSINAQWTTNTSTSGRMGLISFA